MLMLLAGYNYILDLYNLTITFIECYNDARSELMNASAIIYSQ